LRLGGAGALVSWKRWDLVLAALARLPAGAQVKFTHIGGVLPSPASHDYQRELHAMTSRLGLTDRVVWNGWQSTAEELLAEVDVIVVPSDGEPFSMIALEALYAGRPVIATRGGGPEDFILEGMNGWLIPQGDAEALAACITRCCEPATWDRLRLLPGHLKKFSMGETLASRWEGIYASLH